MKVKTKKSSCLVLRKGRVDRLVKMQIQGEEITSIEANSLNDACGSGLSLTDKESIEDTKKNLLSWLEIVDGSGPPGKYKAGIY